jgi:hypothetical protein
MSVKPGKGEPWIWSSVNISNQVRRSETQVLLALHLEGGELVDLQWERMKKCKGDLAEHFLINCIRGRPGLVRTTQTAFGTQTWGHECFKTLFLRVVGTTDFQEVPRSSLTD